MRGARTATVTMTSPGRLLVLPQHDFDKLVQTGRVEEIDAPAASALLRQGDAQLLNGRCEAELTRAAFPARGWCRWTACAARACSRSSPIGPTSCTVAAGGAAVPPRTCCASAASAP